jgi:X-Pro dipeptidyl-peptidase
VLIGANWGDWNVKQEESWNLWHALDNSPKAVLYMGTRWEAHGTPGGDYPKTVQAWFDHYLKGIDNGVEDMPDVVSQMSDRDGALGFAKGLPKTTNVSLYAQETPKTNPDDYQWKILPMKPMKSMYGNGGPEPSKASFPSTGINTESHASHHSRANHDWFWFESPALKKDTRIFGNVKVQIYSTVYRQWITYTPSVFDFNPADHEMVAGNHVNKNPKALVGITRGWLDSRYREGLDKLVDIPNPDKPFDMDVTLKPVDFTFKKGDQIGLNIQTEINEWSVPKLNQQTTCTTGCPFVDINWIEGKTRLILPIVNAPKDPMKIFDFNAMHSH